MTKSDLIKAASKRAGYKQEVTEAVITAALEVIQDSLLQGEEVKLHEFGVFTFRRYTPRRAHNFITGETVETRGSTSVVFKPCRAIKDAVNELWFGGEENK